MVTFVVLRQVMGTQTDSLPYSPTLCLASIRTMPAPRLAAIPALLVIGFREDHKPVLPIEVLVLLQRRPDGGISWGVLGIHSVGGLFIEDTAQQLMAKSGWVGLPAAEP